MSQDALITELFRKLPPAGAVWPVSGRHRWLRAMESALDLLYGDAEVIEIGPLPKREEPKHEEPPAPAEKVEAAATKAEEPETKTESTPSRAPSDHQPSLTEQNERARELMAAPKVGGRPSKSRPEGIPSNIQIVLEAIDDLGGKASSKQIVEWCRKKYWPDVPSTWSAVLWNFAAEHKLARDGINFTRPRTVDIAKPTLPVPAPKAAAPAAPPRFIPPPAADEAAMPFEHKGRKVMLHKKEWRLATALMRAMGKGHLDYGFLVNAATAGERRPPIGDKPWLAEMFGILAPKLQTIGLDVVHAENFGYNMREVEPANG